MTHQQSAASGSKIVAVVFLMIGSIFSLIGGGFAWSSYSVVSVSQRAEGSVIRQVGDGRTGSVAPVVEFFVEGTRHEFQSWLFTSPPQFDVGDKVSVLYDPRDPQRCRIESFVTLWLFPTIFGGIGAVMLVVSGTLLGLRWLRAPTLSPSADDIDSSNFLDQRTLE
ncbi:MAG: DUF3592 domain-containing protein [Planctomycetota bacterium]|nr:MAG: DUF3592 domain-containing protein [Planctomycetota bacterium]GDY10914.1 hypothetical protein LBMAG52_44020 [Planctomycetia bacterium]